ncbi:MULTISPECIES: TIGR01177 family methyltransferase [Halobacterium]|uniref:TIGR01177 family methyltransferase n=1 Tax=Halobacterium TaxID=2239 RepID=UPI0019634BBC|nr:MULTISPECIES: TIGR01177 family methyltransferase [Halobacterium]MCF2164461.1 TIGR01177 family methyltransferase [Halobacterium salinarum]MCF2167248.1 TIGR01177 family methyltransferase [Halobacterium salinarum]MCF2239065.1 TIGR01177 family methyltransferase [Halobacterium salinarum]QRY22414.1 TIGR01177 family methyltransferase [Halobacterium sp. GSL-19]WJK63777.1 TIGR01177 family methyltransferase [Halobacterium salinarum]
MFVLELGGDDADAFAAAEARTAAPDATVVAPGVATASSLDTDALAGLAYTHRAADHLTTAAATVPAAVAALRDAPLDRTGSVAVRARDVRHTTGVDTQRAERDLGAVLVDAGFDVDLDAPDHELRALFTADDCFLGWHVADSVRDYGTRKPTDRPFFQPGSMDPLLARAACNLARVTPGDRVLDPMCGTGGVLIEAGLLGAHPIGTDAQAKMAAGARRNLTHYVDDATTGRADATALPLPSDSIDAAVLDAPYGRQSKIATHDLADLVGGALDELARVTAGRCVLVADRDWRAEATAAGWTVDARFQRRVHRSLVRHILVLV